MPDPVYNTQLVTKFVNVLMAGQEDARRAHLYGALEAIEAEDARTSRSRSSSGRSRTSSRAVEVKSRRVGGATYQVPVEVQPEPQLPLAMRWLIQSAQKRGEKTMREQAGRRAPGCRRERGGAIKKKEDTHRMAEANKAFAHYRW